ncbi:MAG TPA: urea carboxylase-associated family protein [Burkholderiales bacterium]|nr:urea carboxylase-associated family protein [Burkholderiales bacterium]
MSARAPLWTMVLEPGTGKAIELRAGHILRIEQLEGGQCVDFNCFNLHDYKEYMHTGRTRTLYGLHPGKGHFMWSAPPRERPMVYILDDTVQCNDVLFPRCSAYLYESAYGLPVHTNCHDIQSEAQREYGLTPDDVHDSFNLFMHTGIGPDAQPYIARQNSQPGDHVDLLALIDVLAVPNVCGADIMRTSNFSIKPVRLSVFEATAAERAAVPPVAKLPTQRTPADFKVKRIKADRELRRDPAYVAEFTNVPIRYSELAVSLDAEEYAMLKALARNELYGDDDGAALRDIVFSWWEERFLGKP